MKKVLIIVLSSDFAPYDSLMRCSMETWDAEEVEGVKTLFCAGSSDKPSTNKVIYLRVDNDLFSMGRKNLMALEGALISEDFDYIARVNASCYVDKKELIKYVQTLPDTNVFAGVISRRPDSFDYYWGGCQFVLSRDVVEKIVEHKDQWAHNYMEDESMSLLVSQLGIPATTGIRSCSIDKDGKAGWTCISYYDQSVSFADNNFAAVKGLGHVFYRVKQDGHRDQDEFIMHELSKALT